MAGATFIHSNPSVGTLSLRLPPTEVGWGYTVNTSTTPTYAGEVVQILSISFDRFTITGRFGVEGPWGKNSVDGQLSNRDVTERDDYTGGTGAYTVGLTQMTEYFRRYFAVASQGNDRVAQGNYDQRAMVVRYEGALNIPPDTGQQDGEWIVYPVSFPSYRRAIDAFAPEWKVECEVYQAPSSLETIVADTQVQRLREDVGYVPLNPFSDPLATQFGIQNIDQLAHMSPGQLEALSDRLSRQAMQTTVDFYVNEVVGGQVTPDTVNYLLGLGASRPATPQPNKEQSVTIPITGDKKYYEGDFFHDPAHDRNFTIHFDKKGKAYLVDSAGKHYDIKEETEG